MEVSTANWIPDSNRWNLPAPPAWALVKLREFDHMLVLIPSRKKVKGEAPAYLLCRRRQFSAGIGDVAMMDNQHPDTNMCYAHGVVPIGPLRFNNGTGDWTLTAVEDLITELKARDTWGLTGGPTGDADALVDQIEAAEQAEEVKKRKTLWDSFHHRGRDAWRSLTARTGQRSKRATDQQWAGRTPTTAAPSLTSGWSEQGDGGAVTDSGGDR